MRVYILTPILYYERSFKLKDHKSKKKLESSVDNLIEELKTPMIELNNMQLMQLNFLKDEVDFVIKNSVKDKKRIEKDFP